jgi:hypothetical protein
LFEKKKKEEEIRIFWGEKKVQRNILVDNKHELDSEASKTRPFFLRQGGWPLILHNS